MNELEAKSCLTKLEVANNSRYDCIYTDVCVNKYI